MSPNLMKNISFHFIKEKLQSKELHTRFISFNNQLADILLKGPKVQFICSKLGAYNLYPLA